MRAILSFLTALYLLTAFATCDAAPLEELYVTDGTVRGLSRSGSTLYLGGDFTKFAAANGSFAVAGATTANFITEIPRVAGDVFAVVDDGSGGWYVGGNFTGVGTAASYKNLVHITASGALDTSFAPNPNATVKTLHVNGGTLYVGGDFFTIAGVTRNFLAAVTIATGALTSWNPNLNSSVNAITTLGSNVYAGGSFSTVGGASRSFLAEIDSSSGIATSWAPNPDSTVLELAAGASTIFVGGNFSNIGGSARTRLAEIDAAGLATSFAPNPSGSVGALLVTGSTLYVSGSFETIASTTRKGLASFSLPSNTLTSWDPSGVSSPGSLFALAAADGMIYVGGIFTAINGTPCNSVASIDATTGTVGTFLPNMHGTVHALAISGSSGDVGIGGAFASRGTPTTRTYIGAIDTSTGLPTSFNPSADSNVFAMELSGTTLYVGGRFAAIGGASRSKIAALDTATGTSLAIPNVSVTGGNILALDVVGSTLYIGGSFTSVGGFARNRLAAIDLTSGSVTSWNPDADSDVNAIAASETAVFVGGNFSNVGGQTRAKLAKLSTTTGSADVGWNPSPDSFVFSLLLDGSTLYVGGQFSNIAATSRGKLAALDTTTGAASSLSPNPNGSVYSLALQGSTLYVGGNFTTTGSPTTANHVMVFGVDTGTGAIESFNPDAEARATNNPHAYALNSSSNLVFVGGDFNGMYAKPYAGIAVVDGALTATSTATVTGTAKDGQTLTNSDLGTWEGVPAITYSRQWQRCDQSGASCVDQAGETGPTYALTSADVGSTVRVLITGTDALTTNQAASTVTAVVAPLSSAAPAITGTAQAGQALSTSDGSWNGSTGLSFTYGWKRCDSSGSNCSTITGATSSTYTLVSADVGNTIRSFVSASKNGSVSTVSSDSAQSGVVSEAPTATPTATPTTTPTPTATATATPLPADLVPVMAKVKIVKERAVASLKCSNMGNGTAGSFSLAIYGSKDKTLDSKDTVLKSSVVSTLGPTQMSTALALKKKTKLRYLIGSCDTNGAVSESAENNNSIARKIPK